MNTILLKVNDFCYADKRYGKIEHISFHVNTGDVISLFGLNDSGRELVFQVLSGKINLDNNQKNIFINNRTIRTREEMCRESHLITSGDYSINGWNIAEYLILNKSPFFLTKKVIEKNKNDAQLLLHSYGLDIDVNKHISDLSMLQRRMIEIIKASELNGSLLLLVDNFEGMNDYMLDEYSLFLHKVISKRMAVIFLNYRDKASLKIADHYLIFRRGRIVKKCNIKQTLNEQQLNAYLLGHTMTAKKKYLDNIQRQKTSTDNTVLRINNLSLNNKTYNFSFAKGEIVLISVSDKSTERQLFLKLSGRSKDSSLEIYLNNTPLRDFNFTSLFKAKIISIDRTGGNPGIFKNMNVGDNMLLPSLSKLRPFEYALRGDNVKEMLCCEMNSSALNKNESTYSLSINDSIAIIMEKWYVFKPNVLVILEPFAECDMVGISLVKSYIRKFANKSTSVILIKTNTEYMEGQVDRIIQI